MRPKDEASQRRVVVPLTIVHYTRFGVLAVQLKDDGYEIVGESEQTTVCETAMPPIRRLTSLRLISARRDTFFGIAKPCRETVAPSNLGRVDHRPPPGEGLARSIKARYLETGWNGQQGGASIWPAVLQGRGPSSRGSRICNCCHLGIVSVACQRPRRMCESS